jgi:hypothetical protein
MKIVRETQWNRFARWLLVLLLITVILAGCGDDTSSLANDPLAPTAPAGETQATPENSAGTEAGGGGLADNPLTGGDTPTENSAVTGVNPLGEEAGAGTEGGNGSQGAVEGSAVLPAVTFAVDDADEAVAALAADTDTNYLGATEATAGTSGSENLPGYTDVSFGGYPIRDSRYAPRLYIYPVTEFASINETAAGAIEQLQQLLSERPATVEGALPFLPLPEGNEQQLMHTQVAYLDFEGGAGVRYLTQYATDSSQPLTNQELLYTFQGITADGEYYIAALFPVNHSDLPAASAGAGEQANIVEQLNSAGPDAFTPHLTMLDTLMRSIIIQYPAEQSPAAYPAVDVESEERDE